MNKKTKRRQPGESVSVADSTTIKSIQKRSNGKKPRRYGQAERALRESEEKFRNLFEYAKDAIILADTKTGLILDVNTAGCKLLGLPKKKIIGMHQSEIHPSELAEKYKKVFKGHIEKGVVIDEYMIVQRADGKQIPVDISTSLIKMGDKTIIQGIFRDVSERLRIEKALKESQEKSEKAFRSIPEAVSIATLKDGVFLEVNDIFLALNGYARGEVIGHTGKELDIWVNAEDRYRMKQLLEKQGHFENEEFLLRRKTGEARNVLLSADIITYEGKPCILTIGADITEQKRVEEALRQSEAKYASLVERSNDGIIIIENGILKFVNTKMAEMTGFTVEEVIGCKFIDFAAPEEKQKLMEIHLKRMKGEDAPTNYETTIIGRDGQRIQTEINACLITYEGRPAVMAIIRDVTERKQAEQALMDEATRRRILIEQSSDGIVVLDENGKVYDANQKFADMLGYSHEEALKLNVFDWSPPAPREPILKSLRTVDEKGDHFETQHRRKDGTTYDVEISTNGAVFAGQKFIFCVCRDITERKKMEQALRESEEKFSKAFHASPQQIIITRERDDITLEVNDSFIRQTGFTHEETVGKTSRELGVWTSPEENIKLQQKLKHNGRITNEEFEFINKKGQKHTQLVSIEPITIGGEKCWISISTNITERKRIEKELIESEENISRAFEAIPEAVSITVKKDAKIIKANDSFTELTGYTHKEAIGKTAKELDIWVNTADHKRVKDLIEKQGCFENEELLLKQKSGDARSVLVSAESIDFGGKPCIMVVCHDITERKKIEQALRESEDRISKAFQAIPEAISIASLEDNVFLEVNDSFTAFSGYSREEIIGHTTKEIVHWVNPDDYHRMKQLKDKLAPFKNEEFLLRRKSGDTITILMSGDVINFGGKPSFLIVGNDITERKRIENLQKAENHVLTLLSGGAALNEILDAIVLLCEENDPSITGSYMLYDATKNWLTGDGPNLSEEYSTAMKTGIPAAAVAGSCGTAAYRKKRVIVPNIKNSPLFQPYQDGIDLAIRNGFLAVWSEPVISSNGDLLGTIANYSNNVGKPTAENLKILEWSARIAAIAIERRRMEQALKESEEKFSKAFHASPAIVSITKLKDGTYVDVNESYVQTTGYSREELINKKSRSINIWANKKDRARVFNILKKHGRVKKEEFDFRMKSGEIRTWLYSAEKIKIAEEDCLIGVATDITERMEIGRALKESEEKFSKAFHNMPEGVAIARMKDGVFIDVNESFCRDNNYTREEVIGHRGEELNLGISPSQRDEVIKILKKQGHIENMEFEFSKKSGETITILLSAEMINIGGERCLLTITSNITERKEMEQALRESEEKFSKAFHAMPEAVSISRLDDGIFIDINEGFCRDNGYTREEVIGHSGEELNLSLGPGYRDEVIKLIKKRGHVENMEFEIKKKSGEMQAVLFSADTIEIGGEPCLLSIRSDITERKKMEKALKESEEKFSTAFHAMPEAVALSREKDGVFTDVNESFCRVNECTREEIIGRPSGVVDNWAKPEQREQIFKTLKKTGRVDNTEVEFKKKSGEIHTALFSSDIVNIGGEPFILSISSDITERKRMEQALKESEEKFSKAFHAIPETLSISTLKEGRFIDVNESFLKLNRLTRDEVIGHTGDEIQLIKPGDERRKLREILNEKSQFTNIEIGFKAPKSDKMLTFLFSADTIEIGGEPCLLIIGNDITKRKQAEKNLQQALTDLEQNSALLQATNKELESFSYSVSHDLRSPLRSIDGFSQALLEDYSADLDEKGQDYLNRLRNASQKMGELIDGLLKLSRLTRSEMHYEKVDLSSLANEIAARLQETHDKREAKFIIGNNLTATGDPQMLRVLLENLLGNAWKFTKNTSQAKIEFGSTTENGTKTFFIKDNGAGFDMAFKDKLFGAFQRLHDTAEFPGTGIGLATVQRIINRHGGSIRAEGATGKGASFYFTLN